MKSVCYARRNENERLNDIVCYAMRFEQTHLDIQTSSKHFEVKHKKTSKVTNNMQFKCLF